MDCQKAFYDPSSTFKSCIYIFSFLVSMIQVFICSCNFLEDPSVNHSVRGVGFLIKDYPQSLLVYDEESAQYKTD